MPCASAVRPVSTRVSINSRWLSVKLVYKVPFTASASVMPSTGSSSALPSWVTEPVSDWPNTALRSCASTSASRKVSPCTERNVASTPAACCTSSAVANVAALDIVRHRADIGAGQACGVAGCPQHLVEPNAQPLRLRQIPQPDPDRGDHGADPRRGRPGLQSPFRQPPAARPPQRARRTHRSALSAHRSPAASSRARRARPPPSLVALAMALGASMCQSAADRRELGFHLAAADHGQPHGSALLSHGGYSRSQSFIDRPNRHRLERGQDLRRRERVYPKRPGQHHRRPQVPPEHRPRHHPQLPAELQRQVPHRLALHRLRRVQDGRALGAAPPEFLRRPRSSSLARRSARYP